LKTDWELINLKFEETDNLMRSTLKQGLLQFSIVSATTAIALTTTTNAWSANLSFVSSRAALGANDFVDWSNPITRLTDAPPLTTFSTNSAGGVTVTGSQAGAFGQVRVQNPTSYIVGTNSPSGGNAYQNTGSNSQGTPYWNGNFAANDAVYWNQGSGQLSLTFATPVSAVGTQLDSLFYHDSQTPSGTSPFGGTITAFYGSGASQTFTANGLTSALANNTATFFGVSSDSADITRVVFDDFDIPGGNSYYNYAINRVSLRTTSGVQAVPEPFSILGTLFGGAAAIKLRRRFKATNQL
jgi:hypothetical protein